MWECKYNQFGCKKTGTSTPGKTLHEKNCKFKTNEETQNVEEIIEVEEIIAVDEETSIDYEQVNRETFDLFTKNKISDEQIDKYYLSKNYKISTSSYENPNNS